MKLSKAQRSFLETAEEYTPPTERDAVHWETVGVGAKGPQLLMAERMVRLGLLVFAEYGVDVNDHERELPIYAITDAGRAELVRSGTGPEKETEK